MVLVFVCTDLYFVDASLLTMYTIATVVIIIIIITHSGGTLLNFLQSVKHFVRSLKEFHHCVSLAPNVEHCFGWRTFLCLCLIFIIIINI